MCFVWNDTALKKYSWRVNFAPADGVFNRFDPDVTSAEVCGGLLLLGFFRVQGESGLITPQYVCGLIWIYVCRIKRDPSAPFVPRTVMIGGKVPTIVVF